MNHIAERRARAGHDLPLVVLLTMFAILYAIFIALNTFIYDGHIVGTLFDDALISLRYGRHLAQGHGLVWNVGERPPVEGYTNPVWTLAMAAISIILDVDEAPIGVSIVSAAILLTSGWLAYQCARRCGGSSQICILAAVLSLSFYPLVFWSLRGMEIGLVGLLLLSAAHLAIGPGFGSIDRRSLTAIWGLAGVSFLVRMDSLVGFAPILLFLALEKERRGNLLVASWPFVMCIFAQTVFRWGYYGELLPNTYVLKMTGVPISERVGHGLGAFLNASPGPLACMALLSIGQFDPKRTPQHKIFASFAIGAMALEIAYFIWVGGDAWRIDNSNRFFASIFPLMMTSVAVNLPATLGLLRRHVRTSWLAVFFALLSALGIILAPILWSKLHWNIFMIVGALLFVGALCIFRGNEEWPGRHAKVAVVVAAIGLAILCSGPGWIRWGLGGAPEARSDEAFARQGLWLRAVLPKDATIAAAWLGAPSYFSGLKAFDMYGKVDKVVARSKPTYGFRPGHNKINIAHTVGELKPDVVLFASSDLSQYGYVKLQNETWVRSDFEGATRDIAALSKSWCLRPDQSTYCPQP